MPCTIKNLLVLQLIFLAVMTVTQAQVAQQVTPEQRVQANDLYKAQDWLKAAEAYGTISRLEPANAGALYRLGFSFYNLKLYEKAAEAFERSEKISRDPNTIYNIVCVYALLGEKEKALVSLDKAISGGFRDMKALRTDADLNDLRASPEYKLLEEKLDKRLRPCEFAPAARQFDFWIGEWDVKTPQGAPAGTSTIQKLEEGCILMENWTPSSGETGKSVNFFDKNLNKWRQIWIDSSGNSTLFTGEFKEGAMRFEAEMPTADGKKTLYRLTFTLIDKNRVHQLGENSADGGKSWTTSYDLIYFLKPASDNKSKSTALPECPLCFG